MTNQQKFIETFGHKTFDIIIDNCDDVNILKWFTREYQGVVEPYTIPIDGLVKWDTGDTIAPDPEPIKEELPKKRGGGKHGRKMYDSRWYEDMVEDFYLGSERTKNFTLSDDPSLKPLKTMDGLKCRFENAIKALHVEDCVAVHKYYAGTVNECIVLENIRNPKTFQGSYKLS